MCIQDSCYIQYDSMNIQKRQGEEFNFNIGVGIVGIQYTPSWFCENLNLNRED